MNARNSDVHLLIADNKQRWRNFTKEILTNNGYVVDTSGTIKKMIRLIKEDGYDLIILSSDLLTKSSLDQLEKLLSPSYKNRMIVMSEPYLSRTKSLEESRLVFKIGFKDWTIKPMGRQALIDLINTFLVEQAEKYNC